MFLAGSDRVEHNQHRDQVLTFCAMIMAPTRLHMLMSVIFPSFLSTVVIPYRIYLVLNPASKGSQVFGIVYIVKCSNKCMLP